LAQLQQQQQQKQQSGIKRGRLARDIEREREKESSFFREEAITVLFKSWKSLEFKRSLEDLSRPDRISSFSQATENIFHNLQQSFHLIEKHLQQIWPESKLILLLLSM
jgi:hypothetical protein